MINHIHHVQSFTQVPDCPSLSWTLYDQLISMIPDELVLEGVLIGNQWILARSVGIGVAMTHSDARLPYLSDIGVFIGSPLREIAVLAKSWNPIEAAIGIAAINSYINAPSTLAMQWNLHPETGIGFTITNKLLVNRRVALASPYSIFDDLLPSCQLSVLEYIQKENDFPDIKYDFLLNDKEFLVMTGETLINKSLPRLIELGSNCSMMLIGPSVPLTPLWFNYGISLLTGNVVLDGDQLWTNAAHGENASIFEHSSFNVKLQAQDMLTIGQSS